MKAKQERKPKPLPDFLASQHVKNLLITDPETHVTSTVPNNNRKVYHSIPDISKAALIAVFEYRQKNKTVSKLTVENDSSYFIPAFDNVDSDFKKCER